MYDLQLLFILHNHFILYSACVVKSTLKHTFFWNECPLPVTGGITEEQFQTHQQQLVQMQRQQLAQLQQKQQSQHSSQQTHPKAQVNLSFSHGCIFFFLPFHNYIILFNFSQFTEDNLDSFLFNEGSTWIKYGICNSGKKLLCFKALLRICRRNYIPLELSSPPLQPPKLFLYIY